MRVIVLLLCLTFAACASLSGGRDQYFVCPYDTVWEATAETMKGYSVTSENKSNGTIETAWVEMEGKRRPYGIFGREGFGNRERARLTIAVKQDHDVSSVNVLETRQRWHARGGVSQQATRWWPVEPSEEVMEEVTEKLNVRLKEKGCAVSP
ncbi:MAG: hypothetical protein H8K03_06095 [Nitrospira sp.]|jgi:hypothetical protein|nr:hypothetical protein [Nitrospira sp. BO4]